MNSGVHPLRCACALPVLALLAAAVPLATAPASAQSLRPTPASLDRQNREAQLHGYTYLVTPAQVRKFTELGYLVPIPGDQDYDVKAGTSFPVARPVVKLFLEHLSARFHAECGELLTVTSLTRPKSRQPWNASSRSVHPTGMAVDLRVPATYRCRRWLATTLVSLEGAGVLEANREHHPPHYHVAVFPGPYRDYLTSLAVGGGDQVADAVTDTPTPAILAVHYQVRRGDTLWRIAHSHGTSVAEIKAANEIRTNRIQPGQVLEIPSHRK